MNYKSEKYKSFKLNMQILMDALEDRFEKVTFYKGENKACLEGARFYRNSHTLTEKYAYFVEGKEIESQDCIGDGMHMIILGYPNWKIEKSTSSIIVIEDEVDILDLFEVVLRAFALYNQWDLSLQHAVTSSNPLEAMTEASMRVFNNPIFIHDNDFYILASSEYVEGMAKWETDARTDRQIVPLSLMNIYKIDAEYAATLKTHEVSLFLGNIKGHRMLYNNLWVGEHYAGRICIYEIMSRMKPGDYLVMEYLSEVVLRWMEQHRLVWANMGKNVDEFLKSILERNQMDERELSHQLGFLNWGREDSYLCMKLWSEQQDFNNLSPISALSYMESQVSAGHAFMYDQGLVCIVNLTAGQTNAADVVSSLAILLREGLFKVGVSNETSDFDGVAYAYRQACLALEYGRRSDSMIWTYYFNDYAMDHFLERAAGKMPVEYICNPELFVLKEYDKRKNTNLFETLETYLKLEKNVVQTAKALFIHRSTFFYRLERIEKLTGLNLDDEKVRLQLEVSFALLEAESSSRGA